MKKWIRRFVLLFLGLVLGTGIYMICAERISKDPFPMPFGIGVANVVSFIGKTASGALLN